MPPQALSSLVWTGAYVHYSLELVERGRLEKQPEMLALELPRLAGNVAGCNGQKCVSASY